MLSSFARNDRAATSSPPLGAFGERMGRYFHLRSAPSLSTTSFDSGQLVVTRLFSDADRPGMSEPIPPEESFICELHLAPIEHHEIWRREELVLRRGYERDSIQILDLRDEVKAYLGNPLDSLSFYLPKSVLDEFADDVGAARIQAFQCDPGVIDPVLAHLGAALLPALHLPGEASELFFDHLALAINAHLLHRYGGLRTLRRVPVGGLAPSKERRAKDLLASRLDGDISVAEVAAACGLSRTYFIRAFRHSTGVTPHKWLQRFKVEKAREMLVSTSHPIAEVAVACGFSDQSHLTRTFTQFVGLAPAAWRRQCDTRS